MGSEASRLRLTCGGNALPDRFYLHVSIWHLCVAKARRTEVLANRYSSSTSFSGLNCESKMLPLMILRLLSVGPRPVVAVERERRFRHLRSSAEVFNEMFEQEIDKWCSAAHVHITAPARVERTSRYLVMDRIHTCTLLAGGSHPAGLEWVHFVVTPSVTHPRVGSQSSDIT